MSRRRSKGLPGRREDFGQRALRDVRRANSLLESGDHANAAVLFGEQALSAESLGFARPSGFLFLQAGRAHLLAGQISEGTQTLWSGLNALAKAQEWAALRRAGARLVAELPALGQPGLAEEVQAWLDQHLPVQIAGGAPGKAAELRGTGLPLKCPSCGAAMLPDEVQWLAERLAACAYCDSALNL